MTRADEASPPHRILLATDCSPSTAEAEAYALLLAKGWKARLAIVYAFGGSRSREKPEGLARPATAQKPLQIPELAVLVCRAQEQGIDAAGYEREGSAASVIRSLARTLSCDLVVMGTHGRRGIQHVLLGSTAEEVLRTAPCPVLTVRGVQPVDLRESSRLAAELPRSILVPFDFSPCARAAWAYALVLARDFQGTVTLLHVLESGSYGLDFTLTHLGADRRRRERVKSALVEFVAHAGAQHVSARGLVQEGGRPADGILDDARKTNVDLIVMGTHGREGIAHAMSGSVAEAVVRQAICPVLTVRREPSTRATRGGGSSS